MRNTAPDLVVMHQTDEDRITARISLPLGAEEDRQVPGRRAARLLLQLQAQPAAHPGERGPLPAARLLRTRGHAQQDAHGGANREFPNVDEFAPPPTSPKKDKCWSLVALWVCWFWSQLFCLNF